MISIYPKVEINNYKLNDNNECEYPIGIIIHFENTKSNSNNAKYLLKQVIETMKKLEKDKIVNKYYTYFSGDCDSVKNNDFLKIRICWDINKEIEKSCDIINNKFSKYKNLLDLSFDPDLIYADYFILKYIDNLLLQYKLDNIKKNTE